MSIRQEMIDAGWNPDALNSGGYVCKDCGYEPTEIELARGSCPECVQDRAAKAQPRHDAGGEGTTK